MKLDVSIGFEIWLSQRAAAAHGQISKSPFYDWEGLGISLQLCMAGLVGEAEVDDLDGRADGLKEELLVLSGDITLLGYDPQTYQAMIHPLHLVNSFEG